jgi:hypothetical protein
MMADLMPSDPTLGSFGLGPTGLIISAPVSLLAPAGFARRSIVIPNDPRLLGQRLFLQALTVHSSQPPLRARRT